MSDEQDPLYGLKQALGTLSHGAPLVVEDLDTSKMGFYTDEQKDELLKAGGLDDFFEADGIATGYWQRKSDEGVKWRVFKDEDLKLWKDIK